MLNIPEEVKKLFKTSNVKKNIRISFPNGERADITNENLIAESLSYTESVCSQESLKFGLCESSVLEFETAGIGNIKGMEITADIEINTSGVPFELSKEGQSYSFNIRELFGVKLPAGTNVKYSTDGTGGITEIIAWGQSNPITRDATYLEEAATEYEWSAGLDASAFDIHTTSDYTGPVWVTVEYDMFYPVPLGKFTVESSPKQADMSRRKVTAYGISNGVLNTYSSIEQAKRNVTTSKKNDYVLDMEKFYISNIPGDYIPESASMVEVETIDSNAGYNSHVRVNDKVLAIVTEEADKALYYQPCTMTQTQVAEIRKQIKKALVLNFYVEYPTWAEDVLATVDANAEKIFYPTMHYYGSGNYSFTGSLAGGYRYIYPYNNSGIAYENTYRVIRIPVSITVLSPNGADVETITICSENDAKLYEVTLENALGITATVPREKNGLYYSVSSNLPVLGSTIEAFLEFQGRFGMHDRSGAFTTLKLVDSFANKTSLSKSEYSDLWYEDKQSYPYGIVSAIYVNENGEESFSCVNIVKDVDILEKVQVATATPTSGTTVSLSFDKADVEGYYIESPYPITGVTLSFEDGPAWIADFEIESGTTEFLLTEEILQKNCGYNCNIEALEGVYITFEAPEEYSGAFVVSSCKPSKVYYKADECILYDLSGNYLIQNCTFTQEQMDTILNGFAESIKDIRYMPCEIELMGLPYMEAGDVVEIETDAGSFTTIVERRTLTGIQSLKDAWESQASDDHIVTSESSGSFGGGSSGGGGGSSAVTSVNGYTGNVVLKTSDLQNDSNYVSDAKYVHTDNNFTAEHKTQVEGNTTARHTHSNKTVLDGITQAHIDKWNAGGGSSGGGDSTIRYNSETDYVQCLVDGEWVDWMKAGLQGRTYLYNEGVINTSLVSAFIQGNDGASGYTDKAPIFNETDITLTTPSSNTSCVVTTENKVDVTAYSKLYAEIYEGTVARTVEVDISDASGSYYVGIKQLRTSSGIGSQLALATSTNYNSGNLAYSTAYNESGTTATTGNVKPVIKKIWLE